MKNTYEYIKRADEVKGKRTAYTEIDIDASPDIVKKKFLEFDKWSEWCKVFPKIKVLNGDINNLETKPKLDLTMDFGGKKDPQKSPVKPTVTFNRKEVFVWGINNGFLLKVEHVFVFQAVNNGKGTHLIHYERMAGMLSHFLMTEKVKANMINRYTIMNEELKNFCKK